MIATLRYALLLAAGVCGGIVASSGIVNGLALLGLIALALAALTSLRVRIRLGLADDPEPDLDCACAGPAGCPGCPVDHSI